MKNIVNRVNGKRELERVNMLIRALSDEITQERTNSASQSIPRQIEEALYELRLRKLFISALVASDRTASRNVSH